MTQRHVLSVVTEACESAAESTTAASVRAALRATTGDRERIRVCHVSMCLATGGLERLLVEFARRIDRDRFDLSFVALGQTGSPAEEIRALGHPVLSLAESAPGGRLARLRHLRAYLREQRVDVMHSHNTYAHFYASAASRAAGVPVVINTQHGRGCGTNWKQRVHFFLANRLAQRVLAVSEDSARLCRKQDPLSRRKIQPLWNGIDLTRFAYVGPATGKRAISVARLSPEKDFPTLLQATRLVVDQHPDFRLQIVGDGSERAALEQLTRELQLETAVEFLGERKDVAELLGKASLFVSSTSTEGISLTLLEAMAVGLPIITTAVGGNPEVVEDGVTGHLVPAANPVRLAEVIGRHLNETELWQGMSQLARQRVESQFNINRMIFEYESLYSELTSKLKSRR